MKSISKFLIPFAICLILLGMLITTVSMANGARWRNNPILDRVYSWKNSAFLNQYHFPKSDWDWNKDNNSTHINNDNLLNTVTNSLFGSEHYVNTFPEGITSINLNIAIADIQIIEGNNFSIDAININKSNFTCQVENGTWTISDEYTTSIFNKNMWTNLNKFNPPQIKITIPKNTRFDEIDILTSMASIKIDKLISNDIDLRCNMGSINIYDFEAKDVSLNCDMGSIILTGKVKQDVEIDCNIGDVKMYLNGAQSDYSYNINVGLGNIDINDTNFTGISDQSTINKDSKGGTMDLSVGLGNIQIMIRED